MHLALPGLKFHFIPRLMLFRTVIFLCAQKAIEIYMSAESQPPTQHPEDGLEGGSHVICARFCPLCSCQLEGEGNQPSDHI